MSASDPAVTRSTVNHLDALSASIEAQGKFTRAQLDAVRDTAAAITASLKVEQILALIAERAARLTEAAISLVYLVDSNTGELKLMAGFGLPDQTLGLVLKPDEDIAGQAILSGQPQIALNAITLDEIRATLNRLAPAAQVGRLSSVAAVPLIYSRQVLGVLEVLSVDHTLIDDDQVALLQLITPYAASAVIQSQLSERNQQVMTLLEMINDRAAAVSSVGQAVINAGHDLARMSSEVLTRTIAALHLAAGKVFIYDSAAHNLIGLASENLPHDNAVAGLELAANHCFNIRQTFLLQNLAAHMWTHEVLHWLTEHQSGNLVCIPLLADNEPVGVLQVAAKIGQIFDTGILDTLHIIAGQLALGVANARLFDRVRAEQQQLAAILTSSSDVLIGLDATGHIQLANPAAERAFNFKADKIIGQPLNHATLNVAFNTAVETAIKSKQSQPIGLEVPVADDQTLFCNLSPIIDPAGHLAGWVAVMQDITHFKESERSKTDMILTASHDLRNPVNLTLGALDLLGRNLDNFNTMQRDAYELSLLGVHRIETLIADLLDLERIENRIGLSVDKCDLIEIARSVIQEMRLPAQQRDQKLWLTVADTGDQLDVRGDAQRLYQVISNLVGNSIKYTPIGGEVSISVWAEDDHVRFDVRDNGAGIPSEAQARLFQRFYRAPNVAPTEQGTGLGLAIVKSIVEQHGGRVWVTSVVDKGSTFSVSLPKWQAVTSHE